MAFLGIETSCDETGVAIVDEDYNILSNIVSSQYEIHSEWGGIVPELAGRAHIERITPIFQSALEKAKVSISDIEAIGATQGPGLIGSLLVGLSFAKALSFSLSVPFFGIDHLEAHISVPLLTKERISFPAIGLVISGGHTELFYIERWGVYQLIGRTLDDAVGEAFDKVAKLLGLGWPGGPAIDRVAKDGNREAIRFPVARIKKSPFSFSYSGIKTAVFYYLKNKNRKSIPDIAASFQEAAISSLVTTTFKAVLHKRAKSVIVGGGVSANTRFRERITEEGRKMGIQIFVPPKELCTDNGAIIAASLLFKVKEGLPPSPLNISPFSTARS